MYSKCRPFCKILDKVKRYTHLRLQRVMHRRTGKDLHWSLIQQHTYLCSDARPLQTEFGSRVSV